MISYMVLRPFEDIFNREDNERARDVSLWLSNVLARTRDLFVGMVNMSTLESHNAYMI